LLQARSDATEPYRGVCLSSVTKSSIVILRMIGYRQSVPPHILLFHGVFGLLNAEVDEGMKSNEDTALSAETCSLDGVLLLKPAIYRDERGSFRELFRISSFEAVTGVIRQWHQDSYSASVRNVLRGIHYQVAPLQGKLVSCPVGQIFDVVVDLRRSSPTFGQWIGNTLSEHNGHQVWIPEGFGHGFLVLSDSASVLYKNTAEHNPSAYQSVAWDDPDLAIAWPLSSPPIVSQADSHAPSLKNAELIVELDPIN
jgi:dTDP-4-dehydrorhamnose 3,5-epimerase